MGNPDLNRVPQPVSAGFAAGKDDFSIGGGSLLAFAHLRSQGNPVTIGQGVEAYTQWLEARRYSPWTVKSVKHIFSAFYRETGLGPLTLLTQVTETVAREVMKCFATNYKPGTGRSYSCVLIQVFRCFASGGLLSANPFATMPRPKKPGLVSSPVLSQDELRRLLGTPNLSYPAGIRTRALLEVLCSTGLRLRECTGLKLEDVDLPRSMIRVTGRGAQERLVLITPETLRWLKRYLMEVRPRYAGRLKDFWVGQNGRPLSRRCIQRAIRELGQRAVIEKSVSAHTLRRTFAALQDRDKGGGPSPTPTNR
jgi:site-specific recombinase XerD